MKQGDNGPISGNYLMSMELVLLHWRRLWLGLGVIWLGLAVTLSVMPTTPEVNLHDWDKLGHVSMYALLMWWFVQLFVPRERIWVALFLVLLGVGLEFIQGLLPYRQMDWADAAANTAGILLGWLTVKTPLSVTLASIERHLQRS